MSENGSADKLAKRAQVLANADSRFTNEDFNWTTQNYILTASLKPHQFAFRLEHVVEVVRLEQLTFLPGYPDYLAGIIAFRGMVVTALDFRKFLGVSSPGITQLDRIVILRQENAMLGLLVDRIDGAEMVETESMQKDLAGMDPILRSISLGMTASGCVLIDVPALFTEPRLVSISENNLSR